MIQNATSVMHVRFDGRSCDIPMNELDIGMGSNDDQIKHRLAAYLNVNVGRLRHYTVDRHETGNLTVRPEAVFG